LGPAKNHLNSTLVHVWLFTNDLVKISCQKIGLDMELYGVKVKGRGFKGKYRIFLRKMKYIYAIFDNLLKNKIWKKLLFHFLY